MERPVEIGDLLSHSAWLGRLAHHVVRGTGEAPGDLVQETWMAALRSPPSGERPARPWLAEVLRNAFRKRRRDRRRLERREANGSPSELAAPSPEELLGQAQAQQLLGELVLGLEEPYRTTVLLRYFEDIAPTEIARLAREPAGTVRWRLHEALRKLRAAIAAREGRDEAGCTFGALIPLLPTYAPSTLGSLTKGGALAMAVNAKTTIGVAAIVAALAAGVALRSRPNDPPLAVGTARATPAEGPPAQMPGRNGNEAAARSAAARPVAVPKLNPASSSPDPSIAYGQTRPVAWDEVPPNFRSVLSQIALGRQIRMVDERRDLWRNQIRTRLVFEVDRVRHEVMLDQQGKLVSSEVDFNPGELPPPVLQTIKTEYPDAEMIKVERQWREDEPVFFDVNMRQSGRLLELHVSEEGRITKKKWK